jgi:hypothetical protein
MLVPICMFAVLLALLSVPSQGLPSPRLYVWVPMGLPQPPEICTAANNRKAQAAARCSDSIATQSQWIAGDRAVQAVKSAQAKQLRAILCVSLRALTCCCACCMLVVGGMRTGVVQLTENMCTPCPAICPLRHAPYTHTYLFHPLQGFIQTSSTRVLAYVSASPLGQSLSPSNLGKQEL